MGVELVLAKPSSSKSGARKISAEKNRSVCENYRSAFFYFAGPGEKRLSNFFGNKYFFENFT